MNMDLHELLNSSLTKGFLLLPRELIECTLRGDQDAHALLAVFSGVNYKDCEVLFGVNRVLCRRGESIRNLAYWSRTLKRPVPEVRQYFGRLKTLGYLEHIDRPLHSGHIRVAEYDRLTGRDAMIILPPPSSGGVDTQGGEEYDLFEDFWRDYHIITGLAPQEKEYTRTIWVRLSTEEQDRAYDGIRGYYKSLTKKEYCRKAAMYLKYKSFL